MRRIYSTEILHCPLRAELSRLGKVVHGLGRAPLDALAILQNKKTPQDTPQSKWHGWVNMKMVLENAKQ